MSGDDPLTAIAACCYAYRTGIMRGIKTGGADPDLKRWTMDISDSALLVTFLQWGEGGEELEVYCDESKPLLTLCHRLHAQQPTDKGKLYSLHEPEVVCISKGKAHKRYEFGQKVSLATSNRGNWIVGIQMCPGGPYDGHTLSSTLATVESMIGLPVKAAFVDKGYRGHGDDGSATIHLSGSSSRHLTRTMKQRRRRRSAIEPKIGHLKQDHRMGRCFLRGLAGDAINAVLAAAGSNLSKLLGRLFFGLIL